MNNLAIFFFELSATGQIATSTFSNNYLVFFYIRENVERIGNVTFFGAEVELVSVAGTGTIFAY